MTKQAFLGTIGWIKSNLMVSSQANEKGYSNENFYPGAPSIPESEPLIPEPLEPPKGAKFFKDLPWKLYDGATINDGILQLRSSQYAQTEGSSKAPDNKIIMIPYPTTGWTSNCTSYVIKFRPTYPYTENLAGPMGVYVYYYRSGSEMTYYLTCPLGIASNGGINITNRLCPIESKPAGFWNLTSWICPTIV